MVQSDVDRLLDGRTVAVPGLGGNTARPAFGVAEYMQRNGYRIVPIHPTATEVLGETAYRSLVDVPFDIDVVDVFRRAEYLGEVVDDAIAKGVKIGIWGQLKVVDEAAAERARAAGMVVVMDLCMKVEHQRRR
ncbi:MAG TPA: CoA-binding protein [Candidatus Solibacter sp.]|jgi:predicted CoA-binding protein|nr:CoA-binding protein [Candidatus Solibacter sp.]